MADYQGKFRGKEVDEYLDRARTAVQPDAIFDMETKTNAQNTYVQKEKGKGLSENDYSSSDKKKVENAANHISDKGNPHMVTKAQVGLEKVDNTSDADKPVSIATKAALDNKVDKIQGKQLSTEDFTTELKAKLNNLSNYNDEDLRNLVAGVKASLDALIGYEDTTEVIDTFLGIIRFLNNFKDSDNLSSVLVSLKADIQSWVEGKKYLTEHQDISGKQNVITDLEKIRQGAEKGATAVQPAAISDMETRDHASDTYQPKGDYEVKGTSYTKEESDSKYALKNDIPTDYLSKTDAANLYYTKNEIESKLSKIDISSNLTDYAKKSELANVATSGSYMDLTDKPDLSKIGTQSDWLQENETSTDYIKNKPNLSDRPKFETITELDAEDPLNAFTLNILRRVYPVGSIYISISDVSPASLFGGIWERLEDGYTLWTASSGAEEIIDAGLPNIEGRLSVRPNKSHNLRMAYGEGAFKSNETDHDSWSVAAAIDLIAFNNVGCYIDFDASYSNPIYGNSDTVQPPAIKVYMWKRIN